MYIFLCLLIMFLVTFIPRVFPLLFVKHQIQNKFIQSFLYYVPYVVLSVLSFPAILSVTSNTYLSIIGTVTAIVLSFFIDKLYIVSLITVIVVYACSFIFY